MAGSLGWWVMLSNLIGRIRHKIDGSRFGYINRIAGLLLMVFGGVLIGEMVMKHVLRLT
jgi:hypothetical protein